MAATTCLLPSGPHALAQRHRTGQASLTPPSSLPTPLLSSHSSRLLSRRATAPPTAAPLPSSQGKPGCCRALFGLGLPELVVIGGVAVVLFGPKQLPEIGKSLGKTVKGFQEAAKEFSTELKEAAKLDSDSEDSTKTPQSTQAGVTPGSSTPEKAVAAEGVKTESK